MSRGKHVATVVTTHTMRGEGHAKTCDLRDCAIGFKQRDSKVAWQYPKHKAEDPLDLISIFQKEN